MNFKIFVPIRVLNHPGIMAVQAVQTAPPKASPSQNFSSSKFIKIVVFLIFLTVFLIWVWWRRNYRGEWPTMETIVTFFSPAEWTALGVAAALGLSVIGAGW